ncbi:DNA-binding protein [Mycolicibacterium sp. P9-64]|uniref:DNA-binding protein n=1 Tax=Mycolicibacterium sp. P9-64 TaxID=2024612 RepID=UPI0011EECE07|nr:DNA-binding protein [Mycolicibacterium sp. P9-64]KAA0082599.1 DNA-binding protein [Mycolicibacterium sp. P9-64]
MTTARLQSLPPDTNRTALYDAWEQFVKGEDDVRGVRPEVAISWQRCRDQYRVDPLLSEAPAAVTEVDHSLEHDVVFAELGFRAAAIVHEVAKFGIVIIADANGRVLAEWGDKATLSVAAGTGLAPWYCWAESAVGTNGIGTALGTRNPLLIRKEEHWCQAFHDWTCAGVAVRDVVSKEPIASLNISTLRNDMPASASGWLANAAAHTQSKLRMCARDGGAELLGAYNHARSRSSQPLAAVDIGGKVVVADEIASIPLGVPSNSPAVDPAVRWNPRLPAFIEAIRYASKQANRNRDWTGSTQIFTHLADEPSPIAIRPVFRHHNLVGHLISFGVADGEQMPRSESGTHAEAGTSADDQTRRVIGIRNNRMVLLRAPEVLFAESDGNEVWLSTDQGRMRAASPGLDKLDGELANAGFLRVHRQHIVNLNRIREVERRDKGELVLVMDDTENTMVPVSRRSVRAVRQALGI